MSPLALGMAEARNEACHRCAHCSFWPAKFRWFTCGAQPTMLVLDDAFMGAEKSDCPLGHWKNLIPADIPALVEKRRLAVAQQQVRIGGPLLEVTLKGASDSGVILSSLAAQGLLEPEAKQVIAEILASADKVG